ncbi:alpha/beta fold hydrolase [Simkania sp.]|uniref:alpha/beta fold hydrolase n=1 Tax=Simkania sp. TaxID=34094 RepID=UPI003B525CEE
MPTLNNENCNIYYEVKGQGAPLVLINGFTNHLGMWDSFAACFQHQFQVLQFDPRGAGRSETPATSFTIDHIADDVIALLDTLSFKQADMIGFSMGSIIIQSIALRYPDRLGKAVMISPFTRFPTSAYLQSLNSAHLRDYGLSPRLLIEKVLPWIYSSSFLKDPVRVKQTIEELENTPYPQSNEGYDKQLEALFSFDQTDKLHEIAHPTLLIAGEEDLYTPLYTAQKLKELLQNATLEILSQVGHMGHIERKHEVLNLITTWLLQK